MILVTGGTGIIGRHLVARLLAEGEDVKVLTRRPARLRELGLGGVAAVKGDITDRLSVSEAMAGVDEVYHLAALFRHGVDLCLVWRTNHAGTVNVVEEALRRGARLLHVSTVGVMGPAGTEPLSEDTPYNPNPNPYSRSKAEAERYVLEAAWRRGLEAVVVRPAFVYVPGGTYGLNLLIGMVARGELRVIVGSGENYMHPIYVGDLVEALLVTARRGRKGEVYVAANERPVRLRDLLDAVSRLAGVRVYYGLPVSLARVVLRIRGGLGGASPEEVILFFTRNWFYRTEKLRLSGGGRKYR